MKVKDSLSKDLFLKHLENSREHIKDRLFDILNGTSFEKLSSRNLQEITNDLREIEVLENFVKNEL